MDLLEAEGLLTPGTRFDLLGNALVMVAPTQNAPGPVDLSSARDLHARLGGGPLAMAMVDAVPAGIYGKAALRSLGLWESVADTVAQADNVRAALAFVATGAAPLGIVYASDAQADPRVRVVARINPTLHPEITYPVAALATGDSSIAADFLAFLKTPATRDVFTRHGFVAPAP
jgi:molybdate transport system substrate-binding protein